MKDASGFAVVRRSPVVDVSWPRTFRYFRATPRRTAKQNAARFIGRCGANGTVLLGFRVTRYDGEERVAVNFIGKPQPSRPKLSRMRRFRVTETGERVEIALHGKNR